MQLECGIEPVGPKSAWHQARESGTVPRAQPHASFGIRVSRAVGKKFVLPGRHATRAAPESALPAQVGHSQTAAQAVPAPATSAVFRLWRTIHGLFIRKQ